MRKKEERQEKRAGVEGKENGEGEGEKERARERERVKGEREYPNQSKHSNASFHTHLQ